MFVGIRAAWAVDYPLTIVTPNSTTTFSFSLTAVGTFYVDCGDGGTLSGTVGTITPAEKKLNVQVFQKVFIHVVGVVVGQRLLGWVVLLHRIA